jgi:hypothetical protein
MVKPCISLFALFILGTGLFFVVSTSPGVVTLAATDVNELPKPSVPEFTVNYADYSYDESPVYGIDEFTGEEVITKEGRHVDKRSIVFTIKNQAFTPYNDSNGNEINLYFNFRYKGHFGDKWQYYPFSNNGGSTRRYSTLFITLIYESPKISASNTEYTNEAIRLTLLFSDAPSIGSQVDFQVQALIGHIDYAGDGCYSYTGQRSDWSDTQTLTIGEDTQTTSNEEIPEFPPWIIMPMFLIVAVVAVIFKKRLCQSSERF